MQANSNPDATEFRNLMGDPGETLGKAQHALGGNPELAYSKLPKGQALSLPHFEAMARQHHTKSIARAKGDQKLIAEADARLKEQLERFERNRKECRANMHGKTF